MTTTLLNCQVLLSKELGDYFEGTTTTATGALTLVDTSLLPYPNDWITDWSWDLLTSGSYNEESRKISTSSSVTTGTLSVGTHGGSIASGVLYQVHRLFSPDEKRRALVAAAANIFGVCYDLVWNEEIVSGNWLKDGSLERWTTTTNLTDWVENSCTVTQVTTAGLFKHGSASARITGNAGTLSQTITQNDDLRNLAGKTVTVTAQGWCSTASCLRMSVYDGTTQTFSPYHGGSSVWTQNNPRNDSFYVQATIAYNPSTVTINIVNEIANSTSYVDDVRVISGYKNRLYIGHLGLAKNQPNEILIEPYYYSQEENWLALHDWEVDEDGYLHLPSSIPNDYRLRIIGKQYLDFLASGASSTAWTSTINLDAPQIEILVAEAAVYLYTWMSMPNFESGTREDYQGMIGFWKDEAKRRKAKFGMPALPVTVSWGHQ